MPNLAAPPALPDTLRRLATLRGGVISTKDLRDAGIDRTGTRSLARAGQLTQVLRGAWSLRPDPGAKERAIAAALVCQPEAVVSHEAAAALLGWCEPWPTDPAHLWLPPSATRGQQRALVRLHWGLVLPHEITARFGVAVTTSNRTARDILKFRDREAAVALLDQGLHRELLRPQDLAEVATALGPKALAVARLTDARSESPLESRVRLLLHRAGLMVEPQIVVDLPGGRRARIDLGWKRWKVGVECDGRQWHEGAEAVTSDGIREGAVWAQGWHLVRVTWLRLRRDPRGIVEEARRALVLRQSSVA